MVQHHEGYSSQMQFHICLSLLLTAALQHKSQPVTSCKCAMLSNSRDKRKLVMQYAGMHAIVRIMVTLTAGS